jgi:hypothetical protein
MQEDQWRSAGVNFYQENVVPSLEPTAYLGTEEITVRIQVLLLPLHPRLGHFHVLGVEQAALLA